MNNIHVFWGPDSVFEQATSNVANQTYLQEVLAHIGRTELVLSGIPQNTDTPKPLVVENLVVFTDDYGALREWALLGFTKNVLHNQKVEIQNLWLNNPPQPIFDDIIRNNPQDAVHEHHPSYSELTDASLRKMVSGFSDSIIGQDHVVKNIATAIYSLNHPDRKRPITLLFLGESGVGKTETAKYLGLCLNQDMVRIQFSMQQTTHAYQFIFGADHGENSLARELIRRKSNIILLDEFDKVSPSLYNAFYQMFDEGLFVDANYSVDVSKSIIICTSNFVNEEDAEKYLGSPIYSRFSKVIQFHSISNEDRVRIAQKYVEDAICGLSDSDRNLVSSESIKKDFATFIYRGNYRNIRMLKNDIEDAVNYHILKAKQIL